MRALNYSTQILYFIKVKPIQIYFKFWKDFVFKNLAKIQNNVMQFPVTTLAYQSTVHHRCLLELLLLSSLWISFLCMFIHRRKHRSTSQLTSCLRSQHHINLFLNPVFIVRYVCSCTLGESVNINIKVNMHYVINKSW